MPAGITASNIRNNRKKLDQQQRVGFAGVNDGKALNEIHSINGSEEFIGGRRRVGIITVLFSPFWNVQMLDVLLFARKISQ